ncbi:MAG: FAD-binding protein [Acidimicrobiia bacterium]
MIKQVPDVRAGTVRTKRDGTIDRRSAKAITNPVDLHALEAALRLADESWAVSMGPRQAEAALREALELGADHAILISDPAVAGSDTWATANVLAAAIRTIGEADLILCGTNTLDGETGQVGPQVAERLGIPHVSGCEDLWREAGTLVARRVVEGGFELVEMPLPALATVGETGFSPRYPTLAGRRWAASAEVDVLKASDLGLGKHQVGLEASPTKVARMELIPLPDIRCRYVGEEFTYEDLVGELIETSALMAASAPLVSEVSSDTEPAPPFSGEPSVWVVGETQDGLLTRASAELLSKATELAPALGEGVAAFLAGEDVERAAAEAATFGADVVLEVSDPQLTPFRCLPHTRVLSEAISNWNPEVLLLPATTTGRELAARLAARLGTGLAADCTDLAVSDWTRAGREHRALLHQIRPAMSGGVNATCVCPERRPQMATVRPGVFMPVPSPRKARRVSMSVALSETDLAVQVRDRRIERSAISLVDAKVIVAGGAGCSQANWQMVETLADTLGGHVAASRGAVEAGLAPRSLQIGQTGLTVGPDLYVACGISGALQHVVGFRAADTVVAINRDPEAPIFRFAHFGIVDDVKRAVPRLTEVLRQRE